MDARRGIDQADFLIASRECDSNSLNQQLANLDHRTILIDDDSPGRLAVVLAPALEVAEPTAVRASKAGARAANQEQRGGDLLTRHRIREGCAIVVKSNEYRRHRYVGAASEGRRDACPPSETLQRRVAVSAGLAWRNVPATLALKKHDQSWRNAIRDDVCPYRLRGRLNVGLDEV
jgi:hypothetical protein